MFLFSLRRRMEEARLKTHIIKCREKRREMEIGEKRDMGTLTPCAIAFIMMMYVIKYQLISIIKRRDSQRLPPSRASLDIFTEVINTQYPSVILLSTTRKCDNRIMIAFHHHFKVPSSFFSSPLEFLFSLSRQIVREFRLNWFSARACSPNSRRTSVFEV